MACLLDPSCPGFSPQHFHREHCVHCLHSLSFHRAEPKARSDVAGLGAAEARTGSFGLAETAGGAGAGAETGEGAG